MVVIYNYANDPRIHELQVNCSVPATETYGGAFYVHSKQSVCNPCLPVPFQPHVQPIITIAVGSFRQMSTVPFQVCGQFRIFTPHYVRKYFTFISPFVEWSVHGASQTLSRGCLRFYLHFPRMPSQKEQHCIMSYSDSEMDFCWAGGSTAVKLNIERELCQTNIIQGVPGGMCET